MTTFKRKLRLDMSHRERVREDLIDTIVWSPSEAEIRGIYPKYRHEQMIKMYREIKDNAVERLKELVKEDSKSKE